MTRESTRDDFVSEHAPENMSDSCLGIASQGPRLIADAVLHLETWRGWIPKVGKSYRAPYA
jgi:hypothetical protein